MEAGRSERAERVERGRVQVLAELEQLSRAQQRQGHGQRAVGDGKASKAGGQSQSVETAAMTTASHHIAAVR